MGRGQLAAAAARVSNSGSIESDATALFSASGSFPPMVSSSPIVSLRGASPLGGDGALNPMDVSMDEICMGSEEEGFSNGDEDPEPNASPEGGASFALGPLSRDLLMDILNSDELSIDDVGSGSWGVSRSPP